GRYSLVEIELHTGRTHQIRAQMAHAGHPLLGDAKYGLARDNRDSGYRFQALCAWRLRFDAGDSAEHLEYLNGRLFEVPQVWFVKDLKDGTLQ
ncbi:MAG: RNA pseudouridine synthase, partial [Oscillospiraceae bacterium]